MWSRSKRSTVIVRALGAVCESLERRQLLAAVFWDGAGDGTNWFDPNNWSTSSVPGPSDDVTISLPGSSPTITANASSSIRSLVCDETLKFMGYNGLTVSADSSINGNLTCEGSLTVSAGTLTVAGDLTCYGGVVTVNGTLNITGHVLWYWGSWGGAGTTVVASGGVFDIASDYANATMSGTFINNGTFNHQADETGFVLNGVFTNSGTFNAHMTLGDRLIAGSGTLNNTATGTFRKLGSFQYRFGGPSLINAGKMIADAGTLAVDTGTITLGGTMEAAGGAKLNIGATTTYANDAILTGAGTVNLFAGHIIPVGASVTANAALTTFSYGTLDGAGTFVVDGAFEWRESATMGDTGQTVFTSNAVVSCFSRSGFGYPVIAGSRIVHNHGVINRGTQGTGDFAFGIQGGGVLDNAADGRINLSGPGTYFSGNGMLNNFGIIERSGPGSSVNVGTNWNNSGTIRASSGTMVLDSGTLNLGGTLETGVGAGFTLGDVTYSNGARLGGGGTFGLYRSQVIPGGATMVANASLTRFSFGTLSGAGTFVVDGPFAWDQASTMNDTGTTIFSANAVVTALNGHIGPAVISQSRQVINHGVINIDRGPNSDLYLTVHPTATFTNAADGTVNLIGPNTGFAARGTATINNLGTLNRSGAGTSLINANVILNNAGTVNILGGTLNASGGVTQVTGNALAAGTWNVFDGATLQVNSAPLQSIGSAASVRLDGPTSSFPALNSLITNNGVFTLSGGRDFTTPLPGLTNNGRINLGAGSTLSVTKGFMQSSSGELQVDIAGPTDFGQIVATSTINPSGTVRASVIAPYDPPFTQNFIIATGIARSGEFSTFGGGATPSGRQLRLRYDATSAIIGVAPQTPPDLIDASDTGPFNNDNVTNDNTPTITGTAENGTTVRLYAGGVEVGSAAVVNGTYSVTASALSDGVHVLTVKAEDAETDLSDVSAPLTVTIDTVAPAAPQAIDLRASSDSGVSDTDNITNQKTVLFNLSSTDTYYHLERNGVEIFHYSMGNGFTEHNLSDGLYSYVMWSVDLAGNVSAPSPVVELSIDTLAPDAVTIDLNASSDSGISNNDNLTYDNTPSFTILTSYYEIERNGTIIRPRYATGPLTDEQLADGEYTYSARAFDAAGNASVLAPSLIVRIDTVAPDPVEIDLEPSSDSGVSSTDNITNDTSPTFSIAAAYYSVDYDGNHSAQYLSGPFTVQLDPLTHTWDFRVRAMDAAGNTTQLGPRFDLHIDVDKPTASSQFETETLQSVKIAFSETVQHSLTAADLSLQNLTTAQSVPPEHVALAHSALQARFTFPGVPGGVLGDGNYRALIAANSVTDVAGNPLAADHVLNFSVLAGDVNADLQIGFVDLLTTAANFGTQGSVSSGDTNFDNQITFVDLLTVASRFGTTLPQPAVPVLAAAPAAAAPVAAKKPVNHPLFSAARPIATKLPRRVQAATGQRRT